MSEPMYLSSEMNVMVDCDDTLVMWGREDNDVTVEDPYKPGHFESLKRHERHIKLIEDYRARGYTVIVWSAAGAPWAKAVVKALNLEKSVDIIMSKPLKYVDDLPGNEILGNRVYIKDTI